MRKRRALSQPVPRQRRHADPDRRRGAANGHVAVPAQGSVPAAPLDTQDGKVVPLATRPSWEARTTAALAANRCAKCQSTFVMREPAFLHCYYCGAMTRIPSGSLLEQELFELRSGLRLAS